MTYPWTLLDENRASSYPRLSAELNVTSATPPACLTHAADDATAPFENSLAWFTSLHAAGVVASRLEVGPRGSHGFGLCSQNPDQYEVCSWPLRAFAWMRDLGRLR